MAKVFFAFPYRFDDEHPHYRVALKEACRDNKHEAVFASAVPTANHLLNHIQECIEGCDASVFDVTGLNSNVLIEFGLAYSTGKPTFVLLNQNEHRRETKSLLGKTTFEPLEIPSDMAGIVRTHYTSTHDLRQSLNKTFEEYFPSKPEVMPLATSVLEHLKRFGALPMTSIATALDTPYDKVKPVVWALLANDQLVKSGAGPGTKYGLPPKPERSKPN